MTDRRQPRPIGSIPGDSSARDVMLDRPGALLMAVGLGIFILWSWADRLEPVQVAIASLLLTLAGGAGTAWYWVVWKATRPLYREFKLEPEPPDPQAVARWHSFAARKARLAARRSDWDLITVVHSTPAAAVKWDLRRATVTAEDVPLLSALAVKDWSGIPLDFSSLPGKLDWATNGDRSVLLIPRGGAHDSTVPMMFEMIFRDRRLQFECGGAGLPIYILGDHSNDLRYLVTRINPLPGGRDDQAVILECAVTALAVFSQATSDVSAEFWMRHRPHDPIRDR